MDDDPPDSNAKPHSSNLEGGEDVKEYVGPSVPSILRRLRPIVWPTYKSKISIFVFIQVCAACVYAWSYNYMSNHAGNIVEAIVDQDKKAFWSVCGMVFLSALLGSLSNSLIISLGEYMCHVCFRSNLTEHLQTRYVRNKSYYKVALLMPYSAASVDPHIRLANDVNVWCHKVKLILFGTPMYVGYVATTITCGYFFYTLVDEGGWFVPIGTIVIFIFSSIISVLLGKQPTKATHELATRNSRFLKAQTHFSLHAEHIAFLGGEVEESRKLGNLLTQTFPVVQRASCWQFPLNAWTMLFYWGNQLYSSMLPGLGWLWGTGRFTDYTIVVNVSSVAYSFMGCLTTYLLLAEEWSELIALTRRIGEFLEALDEAEQTELYGSSSNPSDGGSSPAGTPKKDDGLPTTTTMTTVIHITDGLVNGDPIQDPGEKTELLSEIRRTTPPQAASKTLHGATEDRVKGDHDAHHSSATTGILLPQPATAMTGAGAHSSKSHSMGDEAAVDHTLTTSICAPLATRFIDIEPSSYLVPVDSLVSAGLSPPVLISIENVTVLVPGNAMKQHHKRSASNVSNSGSVPNVTTSPNSPNVPPLHRGGTTATTTSGTSGAGGTVFVFPGTPPAHELCSSANTNNHTDNHSSGGGGGAQHRSSNEPIVRHATDPTPSSSCSSPSPITLIEEQHHHHHHPTAALLPPSPTVVAASFSSSSPRHTKLPDEMIVNVSFQIHQKQSIVIMGPSGIGKTSLLRVIAGLWPARGGIIRRPAHRGQGGLMYVPQKPYLTSGTLEQQIVYPNSEFDFQYFFGPIFRRLVAHGEFETYKAKFSGLFSWAIQQSQSRPPNYYATKDTRETDSCVSLAHISPTHLPNTAGHHNNNARAEASCLPYQDDKHSLPDELPIISNSSFISKYLSLYEKGDKAGLLKLLLSEVGLEYLSHRLQEVQEWGNVLSVGEQQRLGTVRVLYHQPVAAVLDESTSAVDEPTEEMIFQALGRREIAMLSVAHRSTVAKWHHKILKVARDGSWVLHNVAAQK